jgi:hypothetical protein
VPRTSTAGDNNRVFVFLPAAETKIQADLELELQPETIVLLDEILAERRRLLPCAEGSWFFSGMTGGPRSYSAMRDTVNLSTAFLLTGPELSGVPGIALAGPLLRQ